MARPTLLLALKESLSVTMRILDALEAEMARPEVPRPSACLDPKCQAPGCYHPGHCS